MRMLAAMMVLASHAFAIATGDVTQEPLRLWLGVTPGTIAVDIFFIISGLLVTQSVVRHASAYTFARARFLRVWPGLIVAISLTVFALGPMFTRLSLTDYATDWRTWRYLADNLFVVHRTSWALPGVFADNPLPDTINGSLWTLRYEVRAYGYLLLAWWVAHKFGRDKCLEWLILAIAFVCMTSHLLALRTGSVESSNWRLYAMFATGGALYMFRSRVPLATPWGLLGLLALGASLASSTAFGYVYSLALPYVVVWLAYAPAGLLGNYSRMGDYSYGTYIYAFPVQQAVAALWPAVGVASMFGTSLAITLVFAFLSWHLIEKPAMTWKVGRRDKAIHGVSKAVQ